MYFFFLLLFNYPVIFIRYLVFICFSIKKLGQTTNAVSSAIFATESNERFCVQTANMRVVMVIISIRNLRLKTASIPN